MKMGPREEEQGQLWGRQGLSSVEEALGGVSEQHRSPELLSRKRRPQDYLPIGQERKLSGHRKEEEGSEGKVPAVKPAAGGRARGDSRNCCKESFPGPHPAGHS